MTKAMGGDAGHGHQPDAQRLVYPVAGGLDGMAVAVVGASVQY